MTATANNQGPANHQGSLNKDTFNQELLDFIAASPTPFHAVQSMRTSLLKRGFVELNDNEKWQLEAGKRYFVTRNGSSIIAFVVGQQSAIETGIRMVGAHTDSPCLKVKPQPELKRSAYFQLGVEVYGGVLLNPWFDRDLSIAGRVVYREVEGGPLRQTLINFERPVAILPSLAIHLDREANNSRTVNPQTDIPPLLFVQPPDSAESETDFRALLARELGQLIQADDKKAPTIIDYELCLYDCQRPSLVGLNNDFIASARLDNLLSCYTGMQALLESGNDVTSLLVCNDHEEVGSASACGAQGPMLQSVLERLYPDTEERTCIINRSLMVSADNAHGVHPNFKDKHDSNHGPVLNAGPVIKVNANQRYATSSVTSALFRTFCEQQGVPVQVFVNRTDLGCGSTIGPITASEVGVPTLDVGVPTFAMHSIRELAGSEDAHNLYRVLRAFYCHTGALQIEAAG